MPLKAFVLIGVAAVLAGTLPVAGAQTTATPPPAIAAATVHWLCSGSACRQYRGGFAVDPTRIYCHACGLQALVMDAYGFADPRQITGADDWMDNEDRYNFDITSAAPISRTDMMHVVLRTVLERCFSLQTRTVTKSVPGYELVVAPGGIKFPTTKKQEPFRIEEGIGYSSTIAMFVGGLNQYYYSGKVLGITRPIRDATGLHGFYSIPLPVAPAPDTNLLATLGKLGLALKPAPYDDSRLEIVHIENRHANCTFGPSK